jgi:hypothetical protein
MKSVLVLREEIHRLKEDEDSELESSMGDVLLTSF